MRYNIQQFESLVQEGYLRKSEKDDLVLYGYTDKTTFDRNWNSLTRGARGLILNKHTGEVVAKPFPKFFNLGEIEETFLKNLPLDLGYQSFEKVDGSLGIIFNYNQKWDVSTRGSFYSEQCLVAKEMLSRYNFNGVSENITLLAEIIYPTNKIVVDYKGQSKLVLLGAFNRVTEAELSTDDVANLAVALGMELAKKYNYSIEEMIELKKTLPKDNEGFVVRFSNGLRVKIKGDEYIRIAKIIANLSPISFWECMEDGVVKNEYLSQIPEEFKSEYEPLVKELENQYIKVKSDIESIIITNGFNTVYTTDANWRRTVGIKLKESNIKHSGAIFPFLLKNKQSLDKYILKTIRPTGNEIRLFE